MEEKVNETLKIMYDDGDSFSKRAEMYYRRRPEIISFVEESFRAYRSLAERYDHLSRELQSANRTIASVFPEQVQYPMDDDEYEDRSPGALSSSNDPNNPAKPKSIIPKVPKTPKREFRSQSMFISRKGPINKRAFSSSKSVISTQISGLSKAEALAEIDKLQKEILALQTEKEFVRSLYDRAYQKYWEIEDQIEGMQKKVCSLQDEFGVGTVIEDNDARTLMAATALKSCQETLEKLQEIQAKSSEEAKIEYERVKQAHEKFETLRDQFISKHLSHQDADGGDKSEGTGEKQKNIEEEKASLEQETQDLDQFREKIKKQLEEDSGKSFTVTEMADRIDELVNKVVTLETAVSSQTGLVKRLRSETDDLQTNITSLEEDKEILKEDSEKMKKKLKKLEEELRKVKSLNRSVKSQDNSLQTHFTEASCNLEHLSGRIHEATLDEDTENLVLYKKMKSDDVTTTNEKDANTSGDAGNEFKKSSLSENMNFISEEIQKLDDLSETVSNHDNESQGLRSGEEEEPNWRQMFISGLDDREKILLEEYTSVLRNYKDVRTKLDEVEKKNRDGIFELALQVREMRGALNDKDKVINFLRQKLVSPENPDESPYTNTPTEYKFTPLEGLLPSDSEISSLNLDAIPVRTSFADIIEGRQSTGKSSKYEDIEKFGVNHVYKRHSLSTLEKRFRANIDNLLEENLEFWLRFSTALHQIQKFQDSIQDLQSEIEQIRSHNNNKSEGHSHSHSNSKHFSLQSEIRPIFRHMSEIKTELSLWLQHNSVFQDELHGRYSSLCNLQDELSRAAIADSELSGYQAAKFQGEILNMKQENNKVASELQAGLSLVKRLKEEVNKTLEELDQVFEVSVRAPIKHSSSSSGRIRIPLRSFLFGAKLRRQKQSIFACVNPAYSNLDANEGNNAPI